MERGLERLRSEAFAVREYWQLAFDPVFRGRGLPRGDGRRVLVLPGLFGNDVYLHPLRTWLKRLGYRPVASRIGVNAGCPNRLRARVEAPLERHLQRDAGPVAVIGHSRGGMLGKAIATRLGARCSHFIALGSPVGAMLRAGPEGLAAMAQPGASNDVAAASVADAGRRAMRFLDPDCDAPACRCEYFDDLLAPLPASVRVTSIYTPDDPIVSPGACPIPGATNLEVAGTHSGLAFNRDAYTHIARALAER